MKIGLAYDLRDDYLANGYSLQETAEFDRADTIDAIEQSLQNLGHETLRIGNISSLVAKLAAGERWDLVFNIAEGMYGPGREAQVPALLEAYQIPFTFSDSLVLALTLDKGLTKRVLRDQGIATPRFSVLNKVPDSNLPNLDFPLFAKPLAEGTSKGISGHSLISNLNELQETVGQLLREFNQPVLVEEYLPGREFTVGIIGNGEGAKTLGTMEVLLQNNAEQNVYSYLNKANYETRVAYQLVNDAAAKACEDMAIRVWMALGCRDAGRVDLRLDANGAPSFMEVNPLAGLNPQHSDICILARLQGIHYQELISRILQASLTRLGMEHLTHSKEVFGSKHSTAAAETIPSY